MGGSVSGIIGHINRLAAHILCWLSRPCLGNPGSTTSSHVEVRVQINGLLICLKLRVRVNGKVHFVADLKILVNVIDSI